MEPEGLCWCVQALEKHRQPHRSNEILRVERPRLQAGILTGQCYHHLSGEMNALTDFMLEAAHPHYFALMQMLPPQAINMG